jgi:hypothetical protein
MRVESGFSHDHKIESLQQNLRKPPFTVIMTDIQKLNFFVSVTKSVFKFCRKSLFFNVNRSK